MTAKTKSIFKASLVLVLVTVLLAGISSSQTFAKEETPVITLGSALSLTGDLAREGKLYKNSYDLAVDYINDHGGVKVDNKTYKLKIKYYDDESSATKSSRLVQKLITRDKVDFLLGPYSSGLTIPDSAIAEKYQVPMIEGGGASGKIFSRGFDYIFGTLPAAGNYFKPVLEMGRELDFEPAPQKVALLFADDAFDLSVAKGTREKWVPKFDYDLVMDQKYTSGTKDFTSTISRLKAKKPDIILLAGHAEESLVFVQQAKSMNLNAKVLAFTVGPPTSDFREALGKDAEYIYGVPSWTPILNFTDTAVFGSTKKWIKLFEDRFGYEPDYHNASGTADVVIFKEAIEKAGTIDPKAVRDEIANIEVKTIYGKVQFAENGQILGGSSAIQIQEGEVELVYPGGVAPEYPTPNWKER